MRNSHTSCFAAHRGFTLVESIIALVVLGIASASIISLQSTIFNGQANNKNMEVGTQLMQECAELVLATRRGSGYAAVPESATSPICNALGSYGGFAPCVSVATYAGPACPSGGTCKTAEIGVTKTICSAKLTPVTLMLVSY